MKRQIKLALSQLPFLFALIGSVNAADDSFANQFLGSPLLALAAIIAIDIIALIYHKIRK
jgi:hypothetical protein